MTIDNYVTALIYLFPSVEPGDKYLFKQETKNGELKTPTIIRWDLDILFPGWDRLEEVYNQITKANSDVIAVTAIPEEDSERLKSDLLQADLDNANDILNRMKGGEAIDIYGNTITSVTGLSNSKLPSTISNEEEQEQEEQGEL